MRRATAHAQPRTSEKGSTAIPATSRASPSRRSARARWRSSPTLSRRGVLVRGGHSDALYEQVCLAMDAGLRHITHLWSGMSTVRRIGPKRYSGMAGGRPGGRGPHRRDHRRWLPPAQQPDEDGLSLKGVEKLCLVSDAMRASGLGPGEYEVAGHGHRARRGRRGHPARPHSVFAGSISTDAAMPAACGHGRGLSLGDALQMATLTPARILGVARIGGTVWPPAATPIC